ncbi:MAG: peptidylprolyl isomerase [Mucinivorans sp.]
MASLQTLRDKGGVVVAVVIGLALLAFVLGDMLTSGSTLFGGGDRVVAEIDGQKVSIEDYTSKVEYLGTIQAISSGSEASTPEQTENLRNQAWENFIRSTALLPSFSKLGLTVTPTELQALVYGNSPSMIIAQMFTNQQTGMFDKEYLRSFVANIPKDQTGRMKMFWGYLQDEVSAQSAVEKFRALVDKGSYITSLEVQNTTALLENKYAVRFVASRYSATSDSLITVDDAQIKEYYEQHKNRFKNMTDSRDIDYVVFDALPSAIDYQDADKYISALAKDFALSADPMTFAHANTQGQADERFYAQSELTGPLAEFAFTANDTMVYGPTLENDQYTIARVNAKATLADSITISHIVVAAKDSKLADSLFAVLGKDATKFSELAAQYSADGATSKVGGLIGTMDPQTLQESFSEPLLKAKQGDIKLITTPQAIHIIKVNNLIGMGPKIQLATVKYTVEPSEATRSVAYSRANRFMGAASGDYALFSKVAADSSLSPRAATVGSNQTEVQGLKDSREMITWAFNSGDKEKVSKVLTFGDSFVVAALKGVTNAGIAPLEQVKAQVRNMLVQQKKGELLASKMAGATSLEALAAQQGLTVVEATDVDFNTFVAPEVGLDPAFAGGICGMDSTRLSKPIVGNAAVYVAQIMGTTPSGVVAQVEKERLKAESQQSAFMLSYAAFMEMTKIKDLRYKFY